MLSQEAIVKEIKSSILELIARESGPKEDLASWSARLDAALTLDSPLSELGWDSMRLTWLLVRLEERLGVDTSTLALYELFTVGDLVHQLRARMPAETPPPTARAP